MQCAKALSGQTTPDSVGYFLGATFGSKSNHRKARAVWPKGALAHCTGVAVKCQHSKTRQLQFYQAGKITPAITLNYIVCFVIAALEKGHLVDERRLTALRAQEFGANESLCAVFLSRLRY